MIILKIMIVYATLIPILSLMWSNSLFFPIQKLMIVVIMLNLIFFVASLFVILKNLLFKKLKVNNIFYFFIFLFLFDLVGFFVGFLNGYRDKILNDFYLLINGAILAYAVSYININLEQIEKFIQRLFIAFLTSLTFSIVVMQAETILDIPHYPAIASNLAVIPVVYFLHKQKYSYVLFILILILFSGKRSAFLIVVALLPFIWLLIKRVTPVSAFIFSLFIYIFVLGGGMLSLVCIEKYSDSLPFANDLISKFSVMNPLSQNFNIDYALGERHKEIIQSIRAMESNKFSFFIGSGNGFTYELEVDWKDVYVEDHHGVHFAPVDYFNKYGIVFVFLTTVIIVLYFLKILSYFRFNNVYINSLLSYQLFVILNSLVGSNFGLDYFFWISIPLVSKITKKLNKERLYVWNSRI